MTRQVVIKFVWILVAALGLSADALAQPATQPYGPRRPFGGDGPGGRRIPTEEERREIDNWSREHLPNLWELQYNSQDMIGRRRALRQFARTRMLAIQQAKDDPQLAQRLQANLKDEDEIFRCLLVLDRAPAEERETAIANLRAAVRKVVQGLLSERIERLERLKARLAEEEQRLEADQAKLDEMVERRMNQFLPPWARDEKGDDPSEASATTQPTP